MIVEKAAERYLHIDKFVNRGCVFAFSDGKSVSLRQRGDDCLNLYAWNQRGKHWQEICGYDVNNHVQVKRNLLQEFDDWDPLLKATIQVSDNDQIITRSLYVLPIGYEWTSRPGVTIIGDAAHLMLPFAGEGVNLAMDDAVKLSHSIVAAKKMGADTETFHNSIRSFELKMFRRAAPVAEFSGPNIQDMIFTPGAPQEAFASRVRRAISDCWLKLLMPFGLVEFLLSWILWR